MTTTLEKRIALLEARQLFDRALFNRVFEVANEGPGNRFWEGLGVHPPAAAAAAWHAKEREEVVATLEQETGAPLPRWAGHLIDLGVALRDSR
ncbi:MAG: hypothetical protein GX442_14605 [Candidatus Riflebacteria bacterium]|nr:hypothetical protein [Candidatus Riflebacteria bacterium]